MKTLKKLMTFAMLALAPTVMFAADHIVFIHGWQWSDGDKERIDTWDRVTNFMANASFGVPFITQDKILVVNYYRGEKDGENRTIEEVARDVKNQIKGGFPDGTCPAKMDFVVHSMGGLVLRTMVKNGDISEDMIDRVVTLASPHYGTRWTGSTQRNQMQYGSGFIWDLANSDNKINPSKVLCVVGTDDGTVDEWSAALDGCANVRYVNREHIAANYAVDPPWWVGGRMYSSDGICYCKDGRNDVVYRLITEFLSSGTVSHGATQGKVDGGAILFQVVDGKNHPVAFNSTTYDSKLGHAVQIVRNVKNADGSDAHRGYGARSPMSTLKIDGKIETHAAADMGVGAVMDWGHGQPRAMDSGSYALEIVSSKDNVFTGFSSELIPVTRGRTTVQTIYAESVRPLDYVFLIDTTGSMESHINSVKSNAKNLIQTKLLNGARDCRVAVVDYRDFKEHTGSSNDYEYKVRCEFTTDAATAISAINSLSANGGGDTPETVYSGIHACIEDNGAKIGGWRANAIKTIMVLGDAPPHDPEPVTGYTAADVKRWANTLKVDGEDTESGIIGLGSGISIYPVLTSSSSSLRDAFSGIAEETGGKVVSSSDYSSVADAVEEVIVQSVSANGFETEIVTARETDGKVTVRIFGGNETEPASIGYQIVSGSAESGKDFTGTDGIQRLSWAAGERSYKEIVIPVSEDSTTSNDKFFSIVLCDPSGMGLGGINVCRVNLLDKDSSGEYSVGDTYVQGVSRDTEMGSVTGSGFCVSGTSVTLTAVAKPGYVFTSWENGSTMARREIDADDACAKAVEGVATYVASFVNLDDLPMPVITSEDSYQVIMGGEVFWALDYSSISAVEVSCSGLPSGWEFVDGVVHGSAMALGAYPVTFTVSNAKGTASKTIYFIVQESPYFSDRELFVAEGGSAILNIRGGSADAASSVKMYLSYQTAAAADLDLAKGTVDGVTPKGGLKFPLTLNWAAGEIGEKVVTIPVKTDKTVEADEMFTLQLADAQGMGLSEERVYTVTITDSGYVALAAKVANGIATKTEQTQWSKLQRNGYYVRALADTADGGKVTGSGLCAEGKKVTLKATANKNFTFIGWRDASGDVVAATATLVIDRSAKLAANTKTSTTFTGISGDATYYAMFKSDPSVNVTIESSDGYGALVGKVSGAGKYAPGKKVTLKATANPGYVFSYWSWTDEDGDQCYSQEASLSFVMGSADVEVQATFVLNWEDAAHIYMAVADDDWMSSGSFPDTSVRCGIAVNWPIWTDTLSAVTVKATGLPAGLKLVQDKETKEYSVTGVPTTASKKDTKSGEMVPSVVKFTVTTAGKNTRAFEKKIFVKPLPQWAYGTFNGVIGHQLGEEDDYKFDGHGAVAMTVAANGKISGKVALDGTNYTFSASGYSEWSYMEDDESDAYLYVDTIVKAGKMELPITLYGCRDDQWLSGDKENAANSTFWGSMGACSAWDVEVRRDLWKDTGNAVALSAWAGAYTYVTASDDTLAIIVEEKGNVKVAGTLGTKRKVSISVPLHPYFVDVYVTPTKTDAAFFERIYLSNWHEDAVPGGGWAYRDPGVTPVVESYDGAGSGMVTANPKYGQAAEGTVVTLTAKADNDSVFVKWVSRDVCGNEVSDYSTTLKVVATGYDMWVYAVFAAKENVIAPEPYILDSDGEWTHAVVGEAFSGMVLVDDMARPVTFAAKNLPAGLKIDKATGVVSGTPTKPFDGFVTVTATSTIDKKLTGTVEIAMKVRDADENPGWLMGTYNGYLEDNSETTGNPWWGLERGLFTAALHEDGTIDVVMKTGYGLISFKAYSWDYVDWDYEYAEVTVTGEGGEQLTLNVRGDLDWDQHELEGYVTGGVFGETKLQIIGDRYEFTKVNGKYVHKNMSYFADELVGTWNMYPHERSNAGIPDSIYPFTHDLETWSTDGCSQAISVEVKDNGMATVSGTFLGEYISGTVPILVWWCNDETDCYKVIFWQKLENGKECCIWLDLRSHRESGETSVWGDAWLLDGNESNISDADLLKLQFKAELTGIAVVDDYMVFYDDDAMSKVAFLPPQTPIVVPYGKSVLFKVAYDFPDGYGGFVWTRGNGSRYYYNNEYSNPSSFYYGKGSTYGFVGLGSSSKNYILESISVKTGTVLTDDGKSTEWTICIEPVNITFKK